MKKKSKVLKSGDKFLISETWEREVSEDELKAIQVSVENDITRLESELEDAKARLQEMKKLLGEK